LLFSLSQAPAWEALIEALPDEEEAQPYSFHHHAEHGNEKK
jgi:hypothetical protein